MTPEHRARVAALEAAVLEEFGRLLAESPSCDRRDVMQRAALNTLPPGCKWSVVGTLGKQPAFILEHVPVEPEW